MADKGAFLLRTNPKLLDALKRWADDEFRSTNAQLEYILRQALRDAGRLAGAMDDAGSAARRRKPST